MDIVSFLQTYKGRDKVLRLFCYTTKCAAGLIRSPEVATRVDSFSKQLSTSRTCFRLLDDIPTLKDVLDNINSKADKSSSKLLSYFENIVDVMFNIFDHWSWAIDHQIIISESFVTHIANTYCWIISLYINLYRISIKLSSLAKQKLEIDKKVKKGDEKDNLSAQQWYLQMTALKCLTDMLFAVSYLPEGTLWGGFFSKWQIGALGSFSSVVGLYQALCL